MEEVRNILRNVFLFEDFKTDQEAAINELMAEVNKKDIILNMATQAGKSLAYQILGYMKKSGVTIVYSSWIALINDQIAFLKSRNILAETINSTTNYEERDQILSDFKQNDGIPKFLFLTPEMLSDTYRDNINIFFETAPINYFIVDEAHKFNDNRVLEFRKSFEKLESFISISWIALTTANEVECANIASVLNINDPHIIRKSCVRSNIFYEVIEGKNEDTIADDIVDFIQTIKSSDEDTIVDDIEAIKSPKEELPFGIIFCCQIRFGERIVELLGQKKINACFYHGQKPNEEKEQILENWRNGIFQILVATDESYGIGVNFNIPSVRFVIHAENPKNMSYFYHESGRAGNDNKQSYSRVYTNVKFNNIYLFPLEQTMQNYVDTKCRMQAIANYYGEDIDACQNSCDKCKNN